MPLPLCPLPGNRPHWGNPCGEPQAEGPACPLLPRVCGRDARPGEYICPSGLQPLGKQGGRTNHKGAAGGQALRGKSGVHRLLCHAGRHEVAAPHPHPHMGVTGNKAEGTSGPWTSAFGNKTEAMHMPKKTTH